MSLQNGIRLTFGLGLLLLANSANAQDNLDQGKSGAQLFASNCAICHKSPEGLAKSGGLLGVQSFLREHYTASKESAAVIAAYLQSVDKAAGPAQRNAPSKRAVRGDGSGKPAAKKPEAKRGEGSSENASEKKSSETKPSESKTSSRKPAESKGDSKPSEAKPADASKSEKSE